MSNIDKKELYNKSLDCHVASAPRNDAQTGFAGLLVGLLTVFKHLFRRPVTQEYPEKKRVKPEAFRGKPVVENCCACKVCERVCPSGAIKILKNDEKIDFTIDLKKCIFCGNCSYYCPKGAIKMSHEYELATDDANDLKLHYETYCGGENDK